MARVRGAKVFGSHVTQLEASQVSAVYQARLDRGLLLFSWFLAEIGLLAKSEDFLQLPSDPPPQWANAVLADFVQWGFDRN